MIRLDLVYSALLTERKQTCPKQTGGVLSQIAVCIACRQSFESVPESCPFCYAATFVHHDSTEDLNSVCEELLRFAESARARGPQLRHWTSQRKLQQKTKEEPRGALEEAKA